MMRKLVRTQEDYYNESRRLRAETLLIADTLRDNPLHFTITNGITMKVEVTKSDLKTIVSKNNRIITSTLSKIRLPRILRGSSKNLNTRDGVMLCQASIRKRHISPTLVGNLVQRHICVFGR